VATGHNREDGRGHLPVFGRDINASVRAEVEPVPGVCAQYNFRFGYLSFGQRDPALTEQAHDPQAFNDDLTKAEASKRIDALKGEMTCV